MSDEGSLQPGRTASPSEIPSPPPAGEDQGHRWFHERNRFKLGRYTSKRTTHYVIGEVDALRRVSEVQTFSDSPSGWEQAWMTFERLAGGGDAASGAGLMSISTAPAELGRLAPLLRVVGGLILVGGMAFAIVLWVSATSDSCDGVFGEAFCDAQVRPVLVAGGVAALFGSFALFILLWALAATLEQTLEIRKRLASTEPR